MFIEIPSTSLLMQSTTLKKSHRKLNNENNINPSKNDASPNPPKLKPYYERIKYTQWKKIVKKGVIETTSRNGLLQKAVIQLLLSF